jgi:uncharacterized protein (DUF58 family)
VTNQILPDDYISSPRTWVLLRRALADWAKSKDEIIITMFLARLLWLAGQTVDRQASSPEDYLMLRRLRTLLPHLLRIMFARNGIVYSYQGSHYQSSVRIVERAPQVVLVLLFVFLVIFPSRVWLVLLVAIGLLLGISAWWAVRSASSIRFDRQLLHTWAQVGDRLEEIFVLQNNFLLPILAVEISDHSDLPGYNASSVRGVGGYNNERWRQRAVSVRRGVFRVGPTTLRFGDPLGIFEVTCEHPQTHELLVVPPILHSLSVEALSGGGHGMAVSRQRNLTETGIIGGVRDYHPGDPVRRIHWPLSLRHQNFLVKEFDDEKGGDIWLVLDLDPAVHAGEGQESTLEYAIIWAASWAWHLLEQGKGVGLFTSGPERIIIQPASGSAQLNHILRALAPLEAHADIPLSVLLREVKPFLARNHSIVVFTPSSAADWPLELTQIDLRSVVKGVVLLDAATFQEEIVTGPHEEGAGGEAPWYLNGERMSWLRAVLAGMGIPVHLVQHQTSLDARPGSPGDGALEDIVTPWGKVVTRPSSMQVKP